MLEAGADVLETNTFSGTRIAQADYGLDTAEDVCAINYDSVKVVSNACDKYEAMGGERRYICGAIGPTNRTLSISPDASDLALSNITFMEVVETYEEQVKAPEEACADVLLIETIFDTLNAKDFIFSI